jgi:hypothetical protein
MQKFIIVVNNSLFFDENFKNVFSLERVFEIFRKELEYKGNVFKFVDWGEMSLELGIDFLLDEFLVEENSKCTNVFVEMGDDYSEISIVELFD